MAQITKGDTFANGEQLTAARLNQLVDQATILPTIITNQANLDAGTLASDDSILIVDTSESGLREAKASDLIGSNLPIITSSITGQATQASVTNGTSPTTYYPTSDITIIPNNSALVTGKSYSSADSSTIVVTSTEHGLEIGQVVQTSAASTSSFNGTFRVVAANSDTFTYTIPLSTLPTSGTFSCSNGTLVTVTTPVAHGLTTGNSVAFVTSNSAFNITTTITVTNSTTFTYPLSTAYGTGSGSFSSADQQYTVVTTSTNHNLVTGTSLAVTASNTAFSGTYPATVLSPTTFAYSLGTPYGSASASAAYNNSVSPYKITVTKTAHGFTTGASIIVTCTSGNSTQNPYISGTYTITVVDANTFTYPKTSAINTWGTGTPSSATLSISYVLSSTSTGTVTYVLGSPYTGSIAYTASPTGASGTLSYYKKGVVKNTGNKVINGNLYVDGTTTLNSDTRFVGNMTNFGTVTQNGAVTQNGTVTQTGTVNITGNLNATGISTVVTPSSSDNSTKIATTAFVKSNPVTAKAWVKFTGSTGTIVSSYGIASVTRASVGVYNITFSSAQTDANYCPMLTCWSQCWGTVSSQTTTTMQITTWEAVGYGGGENLLDPASVYLVIFGN
ncbi:hypothetical protein UFOVP157_6 [uncultured Caudovirales phage]|uniref:Uncharacterized protein n=1 Tax=uncultured Caudovirales phage TaxID=2100421 RepID=A0A6J7WEE2_9CAUD|nr:hypothetical protein UFOVP157_6 [uncultured Caudovirales phage]